MSLPLIDSDRRLTPVADPQVQEVHQQTYAGQASWAVGPSSCGACTHWNDLGRKHKRSAGERACAEYANLRGGRIGPRIPGHAKACRYFAISDAAANQRELANAICPLRGGGDA